jgi:hypothetical protein
MTLIEWATKWNVPILAVQELVSDMSVAAQPAGRSEANIQASLRIYANVHGGFLWRNNSGAFQDEGGRMVRFGLGNDSAKLSGHFKSSDLIGITPITVTGRTFGIFTAIEVKRPGWTKPTSEHELAQAAFLATVRSVGGIGTFATSTQDVQGAIDRWAQ